MTFPQHFPRFRFPRLRPCLAALLGLLLGVSPGSGQAVTYRDVSADLAKLLENSPVPGLAAAAIQDGRIILAGCAGLRRADQATPLAIDDRFHLGSCTKSMTATLAALLVADGELAWDRTVAEAFPGWDIHPARRATTLRHLLSNTGACPRDVPPDIWRQLRQPDRSEAELRTLLAREILALAPQHAPGEAYEYSNAGFTIAGAMIEAAAGQPYDALLRERLFRPLGLRHAGFGAPATAARPDQPLGHRLVDERPQPVLPGPADDNPAAITPAGRVHASILDFARYASLHLGTEKAPPLTAEMRRTLHQPVPPAGDYALGWQVLQRPWAQGTALTHNGTNTMWFAVMWLAPARHFAAVAACNLGGTHGEQTCDAAIRLLLGPHP